MKRYSVLLLKTKSPLNIYWPDLPLKPMFMFFPCNIYRPGESNLVVNAMNFKLTGPKLSCHDGNPRIRMKHRRGLLASNC